MEENNLVGDFNQGRDKKINLSLFKDKWVIILISSMVLLGLATGYLLSSKGGAVIDSDSVGEVAKKGKIYGSTDTKVFKDSTEGVLQKGGINGEGTHRLIREGGPSQTVYLTSSVIDLDNFVNKKVKVWGETFQAEKAGWLMDVGRIEIND